MPEGAKEAETAQTFDEDEYKSNLIDNEDYSEETAKVKAAKKKEQLEAQAAKGPVAKMIEINLNDVNTFAKTQREKMVTVRRAGTTYQRKQKVGKKDGDQSAGWEMPVDKFIDNYIKSKKLDYKTSKESDSEYNTKRLAGVNDAVGAHAKIVKEAVAAGKKLPKNVLADYPQYK